jgi:hypothetical protein
MVTEKSLQLPVLVKHSKRVTTYSACSASAPDIQHASNQVSCRLAMAYAEAVSIAPQLKTYPTPALPPLLRTVLDVK